MFRFILLIFLFLSADSIDAQPIDSIFFEGGKKVNRDKFYANAIKRSIVENFSLPLTAETEYDWETAFDVLNVLNYSTPWIDSRIGEAFMNINTRSDRFKESLLNLVNNIYPTKFEAQVRHLFQQTANPKILAMTANYLLQLGKRADTLLVRQFLTRIEKQSGNHPAFSQLKNRVNGRGNFPSIKSFLSPDFLAGEITVFSFQRHNRNYPGLAIVRRRDGSFVKNADSSILMIPQLARSNSNMPSMISNGNTPQGIFRMDGFGRSRSYFIGPTKNLQLTMPFEYKAGHFFKDSTLTDSSFFLDRYQKLLPADLRYYQPLYESYYAGQIGRSEIIAHGTTVNPKFYSGKPYYPFTPSNGCLVAEEWWNEETGQLAKSGQYKLYKAVESAGGADGYYVVVELDNIYNPVTPDEILILLRR